MNISTGIYEQIINRLFQLKLNQVDSERFYIGKKPIAKDDAVKILSKYLQHLIEVAFRYTELGKYTPLFFRQSISSDIYIFTIFYYCYFFQFTYRCRYSIALFIFFFFAYLL